MRNHEFNRRPSCRSLRLHAVVVVGALIAASIQSVCAVPPDEGPRVSASAAASAASRGQGA